MQKPPPPLSWYQPESNLAGANLKCIVLSLVVSGGYWFLPRRNKWVLAGLLYFTYLFLAIYDVKYDCRRNLSPTYLAYLYLPFKPAGRQRDEWNAWPKHLKRKILFWDTVVIAGLLALYPAFLAWNPQ